MIVKVTNYDVQWASKFSVEAQNIQTVLGDELVAIQHFGSTSVPGMKQSRLLI